MARPRDQQERPDEPAAAPYPPQRPRPEQAISGAVGYPQGCL